MPNSSFNLQRFLAVLRRQAWLVLLIPVLTVATAAIVSAQQATIYRASMKLVTVQAGGEVQPEFGSQALMQTMSSLLESEVVAQRAISRLDLETTPKKLRERLHTTYEPNSSVLDVTLDWPENRAVGVAVLGTVASVFEDLVDEKLGVRTGDSLLRRRALPTVVASVFDPAHSQADPVAPKPVRTIAFAGILGLALGVMLAIVRESLDSRIRSRHEAEEAFRARVAGSLPRGSRGKKPPGLAGANSSEATADAMRWLRANLELVESDTKTPTILVTSGSVGEGKSTVAAHLAASLALARKHVVCVDADLRRPTLHRYFGRDASSAGLAQVLAGELDLETALRRVRLVDPRLNGNAPATAPMPIRGASAQTGNPHIDQGSLHVVTAGGTPATPDVLLTPDAVADLLTQLRSRAEYIIFDAAPVLRLADTFPLVLNADNVLAVARLGRTTRQEAEAVRSTLDSLGARNVQIALTDAPPQEPYGY